MFRRVRVQITVAQRLELSAWNLDLRSPFWRVYVNNRSGAAIVHEGKRLPLRPGRLYLIPAWVRFQTVAAQGVIQEFLHFHVTGLPPALPGAVFDRPLDFPLQPVLAPLHRGWRRGFAHGAGPAELAWAYALVHAALAAALAGFSEAERGALHRWLADPEGIAPALEAIESRLAKPPANAELARLCNASTDHFIRRFRRAVGMTPARYGIERRVAAAAQWLTATSRSVDAIAEAAGFTDRFHFSRVFKARLGLPPAAYRRMHERQS
jgi:AraC-like DNA-binding protein